MTLTENHKNEEEGGHPRRDVEHDTDVMGELVHVVHVGHQDGGDEEPDGDAELDGNEKQDKEYELKTVIIEYKVAKKEVKYVIMTFLMIQCASNAGGLILNSY